MTVPGYEERERAGRRELGDLARVLAAAHHAARLYPGPVGELVARELRAHADLGFRFGADSLLGRLAAEIMRSADEADRDDRVRRLTRRAG
jgi:hypothetical protein